MARMTARKIHVYEMLVALFVTTLIVSNIASVKLIGVGPLVFDAGTLLFPLAYIVGDIITEVYGFRKMRSLLMMGIAMLIITSLTFWLVGLLPVGGGWESQAAYDSILGVVWRIVAASIIAIFFGELMNAYVLAKLKVRTQGRQLWGRLIGSSAVGGLVDTTLFSVIAFAGTIGANDLLVLIATVFGLKLLTEIIVSPFTMRLIAHIKRAEAVDVFETPSFTR